MLVVDNDQGTRNIIRRYLQSFGHKSILVGTAGEALTALANEPCQLVITDIKLPQEDGIYLLRQIGQSFPNVAVIIITDVQDTTQAVKCLKSGAYDYVMKPLNKHILQISVTRAIERRNLVLEKNAYRLDLERKVRARTLEVVRAYHEIEKTYQQTLEALVSALDFREQSTAGHSKRAVEYTRLLAIEMGIRGSELLHITRGALLHDVGKIGISDTILLKPSKLTIEEWKIMKMHPIYGYQMLKDIVFLEPSLGIVLHHHERFDGGGYPKGLKRMKIPIGARLFSVVDAFDAITSNRVYRSAQGFETAYEVLKENSGKQFDPEVVEAFQLLDPKKLLRIYQISLLEEGQNHPIGPHEVLNV